MKKLILFGNGSFAKLLKWYIDHDDNRELVAATVEKKYIRSQTFEGLSLIPFEEIDSQFSPDDTEILLGVGYSHMNDIRKKVFFSCKEKGYHIAQYIHSSSILSDVQMGEGNIILEDTLIEPFVTIGNGNIIWCKISVAHNCKIGSFNTIAGMASICGFSEIENNCFIGNGSIIRDDIKISEYSLVGAGAYVASATEAYNVIAANKGIIIPNKKSTDFM